jgi:hypothetical protein
LGCGQEKKQVFDRFLKKKAKEGEEGGEWKGGRENAIKKEYKGTTNRPSSSPHRTPYLRQI